MGFGERRGGFGGRSGGRSSGRFGGRSSGGGRGGFGGPRRDFGSSEPAPIKVGDEFDVEISEVSQRGDGVARIKNFVVFVPGTTKGDHVHVKIKEVMQRHAIGEVVGSGESGPEKGVAEEVEEAAGEVSGEAEEGSESEEEEA